MSGGPGPTQSQATSGFQFAPGVQDKLNNSYNTLAGQTGAFNTAAQTAANGMTTSFQAPTLNTNFAGPQFTNEPDAFARNVASQGIQQGQQRLQAQQGQIAQKFSGNNAELGNILQAQAGNQAQMAANPLLFQASADQRARQAQEYQLGQQAQGLSNQANIAQADSRNNAALMGNNALMAQLQAAGLPMAASQNLLSILSNLAGMTGTKVETSASQPTPGSQTQPFNPYPSWSNPWSK